jgi:gamma-glutamylaminecyclotransferase
MTMDNNKETFLLFTYGTLMRGERNEHLLKDAQYICKGVTKPKYRLFRIDGNFVFPAIIDEGDTAVKGEIYECPMSALPSMDRMEGHPHFYCRKPIELEDGLMDAVAFLKKDDMYSSKEVIAYFFVKKNSLVNYPEIKSGNWRKLNT